MRRDQALRWARSTPARLALWAIPVLVSLGTSPAHADETPDPNGVYGRFDGDLDLGFGLGAEVGAEGTRGAARLSAHYYSMVGAYVGYHDALGGSVDPNRTLSLGVDLRPAFVPRWAENLERGPGWLDLCVDSVSLGLGAFWEETPSGSFGAARGLDGSLGFGLPLFGTASGLWLGARGNLRWRERAGHANRRATATGILTLEWHQLVSSGLSARAEDG